MSCNHAPRSSELNEILSFTYPKLYTGACWYVGFYAFDPALNQMRRKRIKINNVGSVSQMKKFAAQLCARLSARLEKGWNPWIESNPDKTYRYFTDALDHYRNWITKMLNDGLLRKSTHHDYTCFARIMQRWNEQNRIPITYIYQFDRDQLRNDEDVRDVWRNALMGWDYFAGKYPDEKPWDKYSQTYEYDDDDENLEEVFYRFNEKRPKDFRGYSLSVGDIVVRDGQAYMVDTFGFTPVDFVHKSRTEKGRREKLAQMSGILRQMRDLAHRLVSLDADYGTYNTEELLEDIDNMIYWIERERDDPTVKSKDKIDPSNPESIRKERPYEYLSREDYALIRTMHDQLDMVEKSVRDKIESIRSMAYTLGDVPGLRSFIDNIYLFEDVDIQSKLESAMTTIRDYGNAIYSMNDPTDSAFSDVRKAINGFIWGQDDGRDYTINMDVPVEDADYDISQYEIKAKKGKMKKCGCGGKMEKEDESPEEPTQEAPQQTTEEDAESDTSDEEKPVESEDEPKEEVEKSVPMLKDPGQMFKACYEYQESRRLNGLYADEISKVCGGVDPQAVIGYHSGSGAVQRIRCSDGYIYRFNGQNMRRL